MDEENPLAGLGSSSDDSGSDSGSEGSNGSQEGQDALASDDILAGLMPVSRLEGEGSGAESDASEDDAPLTAAQIRALRADAASSAATTVARVDFAAELKGTGRVPLMIAISAAAGESSGQSVLRIDWARITKEDMQTFISMYSSAIDAEAQTTREAARTPAWLLQHSIRTCLRLLLELAKQDGCREDMCGKLSGLIERADSTPMGEDHLVRRGARRDGEPTQAAFDHMTDAVQDVCKELKLRTGAAVGPHSNDRSVVYPGPIPFASLAAVLRLLWSTCILEPVN